MLAHLTAIQQSWIQVPETLSALVGVSSYQMAVGRPLRCVYRLYILVLHTYIEIEHYITL
jgi:hypothetical protein